MDPNRTDDREPMDYDPQDGQEKRPADGPEEKRRKRIMRITAAIIFAAACVFGTTGPNGVCLGDRLLESLGMTTWSDGTSGTHYTAVIAILLGLWAIDMFARTTKDRRRTFNWVLLGVLTLALLLNILMAMI